MRKIPGWAFHIIIVVIIVVALWLYPEVSFEFRRVEGSKRPFDEYYAYFWSRNALLGLLVYEVVSFLWRGFSFLWRRSWHGIAMAAAHLLCAGLIVFVFYVDDTPHAGLQIAKVKLLPSRYRACEEQAVEYAPGKKFAVCDLRNRGDLYETIVFDSEGEVAKRRSQRSVEFRNYSGLPYVVEACDLDVTELRAHLYLAASSC